jgi:hypothetical protein
MKAIQLNAKERAELLGLLETRFRENSGRHKNIGWEDVRTKLDKETDKLRSLYEMERTGGEPDIVLLDAKAGEYVFVDCCAESPLGRRNTSYDREGQESRRAGVPEGNAVDMASNIGIDLLTETQYRRLQELGEFDTKTSSWLRTPPEVRKRGGALYGDRRYGRVFVYHNGASSYYSARGFRGLLRV